MSNFCVDCGHAFKSSTTKFCTNCGRCRNAPDGEKRRASLYLVEDSHAASSPSLKFSGSPEPVLRASPTSYSSIMSPATINPPEQCAICGNDVLPTDEKLVVAGNEIHRSCWKHTTSPESFAARPLAAYAALESSQHRGRAQAQPPDGPRLSQTRHSLLLEQTTDSEFHPTHVRSASNSTEGTPPQEEKPHHAHQQHQTTSRRQAPPPPSQQQKPPHKALLQRSPSQGPPLPPSTHQDCVCAASILDSLVDAKFDNGRLKNSIIDHTQIRLGDSPVGEGASGVVYKACYAGKTVAVKMFRGAERLTQERRDEFVREVYLLTRIQDTHIVEFVGCVISSKKLWLVTEFIGGGTLRSCLYDKGAGEMPYPLKIKIALDTAAGMRALHQHNIIHRDLKSDNLLIVSLQWDTPTTVKLTDFGASRQIADSAEKAYTRGVGTPIYMAPEVLKGEHYNSLADVFSFGVFCQEVLTQEEPYASFANSWAIAAYVVGGGRLALPETTPPAFSRVISACWAQSPSSRPTFEQLVPMLTTHFEDAKLAHEHTSS
eukprot:TRINITY_DN6471_c0_g1_i1.p1 TRINITY_DN6471_c0_g1~~TRINITY_DN6471_c0_g1_i1.p1  ORF type:complete len:544 (-),score=98.43 TRINITY_DN6471_c0_g1_i1:107-1738(-)